MDEVEELVLGTDIGIKDRMFDFGQRHLNGTFVLDGIQSVSARDAI
jgi:hypothetical protein